MKKILYIVLGAILVFGLLFLLWTWFFSGSGGQNNNQGGDFGTASSTDTGSTTGSTDTNGTIDLGSNTTNGSIDLNGSNAGAGGIGSAGAGVGGGTTTFAGGTGVGGVTWLNRGSSGTTIGGNGLDLIPINDLGEGVGGQVPTIRGLNGNQNGSLDFTTALLGAAGSGAAVCGARAALASLAGTSAGGSGFLGSIPSSAVGVPVGGPVLGYIAGQQAGQAAVKAGEKTEDFAACILNVLAKVALTQITASVVNWVNSGFNGKPAFVTNYQQFFTNVADQAAGEYIKGSGLAFLCSPFSLKIKIAIAQAYAQRNSSSLGSCSLTKVIKNVNGFMNGNFSQGGWTGFLTFTTMPINNPYGSYAYAQIGLNNAIADRQLQKTNELLRNNGFQDVSKPTNCRPVPAGSGNYGDTKSQQCTFTIVTPGKVVADAVTKVTTANVDQLGLANSFDQIINALMNQLLTRTLYNGLTNLNGANLNGAQTPAELAAQQQAQQILTDLQGKVSIAQQYGSIQQGSIRDIQNVEQNVNTLENCWLAAASSTSLTSEKQAAAAANAETASSTIASLNLRIEHYNDEITAVNEVIALIEQVQTQALTVGSVADVASLQASYNALVASGKLITQADVTTAQQNRTTLQSEMSSLNQTTANNYAQCQNFN